MMNKSAAALDLWEGSATLVVGGQLGGPKNAVRARHNAVATLEAVKLVGDVERIGSAKVEELKESPNANTELSVLVATVNNTRDARAEGLANLKVYEKHACEGVVACFKSANFDGKVDVTVRTMFDEKGKASSSRIKGTAPGKVRSCLQDLAKGRVLNDFKGPPGTMECRVKGRIFSGGEMISISRSYLPAKQ